ncbi:MAG TPA: hypothetical protein PKI14_11570 [Fervidobacterium sp.]|nr:hypothetical protein [Fervidobacterium sp.]
MAAQQQILHGARCQLIIDGKKVGLFSSISYGVNYDVQPSFILGRYSAAELTYTGQDVVSVNATGFRVVENGAYKAAGLPKLQELMNHSEISLAIYDRQTGKQIMTVIGVRPVGFSTGQSARSISDFSVNFLGRIFSDESGDQGEATGASNLDDGN